jgi:GTPase Era involved in 16S rRNA processing
MLIDQQSSAGYWPSSSTTAEHDSFDYMDEVEVIAQQEQMELDTLLALAEQNSNQSQTPVSSSPSNKYDDEEMDAIFMDYIREEIPLQQPNVEDEVMDSRMVDL